MHSKWRWWLLMIHAVAAVSPVIKIGAIFTEETRGGSAELAFKYAVYRINKERSILPESTIVYDIQYIPPRDTFKAYKKACALVHSGAVTLFTIGGEASAVVSALCRTLRVPHVDVSPVHFAENQTNSYTINIHPSRALLDQAFTNLTAYLNWTRMGVIYEDYGYGELNIANIAKDGRDMVAIRCSSPHQYRHALTLLKAQRITNFIVDTERKELHRLFRAILQLQMNNEDHHYIFTSFDIELFDLEDFLYNRVNMSGWRLVDRDSDRVRDALQLMEKFHPIGTSILSGGHIKTNTALLYDAVQVVAIALSAMKPSAPHNVSCDYEMHWPEGQLLRDNINKVAAHGLTGPIEFQDGVRSNFKLQLMRLVGGDNGGTTVTGSWNHGAGLEVTDPAAYTSNPPPNVTLTVVTVEEKPYVMVKEGWNLQGNARFEGFCIDLLAKRKTILYWIRRNEETGGDLTPHHRQLYQRATTANEDGAIVAAHTANPFRSTALTAADYNVAARAGFNYRLRLVPGNVYGARDPNTGEWNGIVRELMDRKADIAVASMTINYARESVIDFTKPFMNLGIGILFKVPTSQPTRLFSFLNPLAIEIWLYVLAAYILVSFTLFVMARFSPYEWSNTNIRACAHNMKLPSNQFTVCNSIWFITGTFLRQGSGLNPKATSTRVVGGIWWFFTLIILSSYTANLAAFLTVERMVLPIQSAADLANQNAIPYGTLDGGSTMTFFRDSNIDIYKKMWQHMSTASPPALVTSYEDGVRRVLDGNYAFLMESTMLDHRVQRDCNLTQLGGLLDSKGYGIATYKGSAWRDKISLAILELQEKGAIQILYDKWWKNTGDVCNRDGKDSKANPLGVQHIGGVFVTLVCGLVIAIVVSVMEFCWHTKRTATQHRQSLCSEVGHGLRTAVRGETNCRTTLTCARCSPGTHAPPPSRFNEIVGCGIELDERGVW